MGMCSLILAEITAEVFSAAQSKGYLWLLSLESASWGAHTGNISKTPPFQSSVDTLWRC
jgi:hypothetical protein